MPWATRSLTALHGVVEVRSLREGSLPTNEIAPHRILQERLTVPSVKDNALEGPCRTRRQLPMIRRCNDHDFELIWAIISDGAQAYKGIIPADRWTEPYMSQAKLRREINNGMVFWGYDESGTLAGVMGIQDVRDVTVIRQAYVRTSSQKRGMGRLLLFHLLGLSSRPVLIGTWADALWAIRFYEMNGFRMVSPQKKTGSSENIGRFPNARSKLPWFWPMRSGGKLRRNSLRSPRLRLTAEAAQQFR
jgi:GNAT superfamily N-acetyltransferase